MDGAKGRGRADVVRGRRQEGVRRLRGRTYGGRGKGDANGGTGADVHSSEGSKYTNKSC